MDELFEHEVTQELESLRQHVRFLEQEIAKTKPPFARTSSPARDIEWNGQQGTLGAILPKIGDSKKPHP